MGQRELTQDEAIEEIEQLLYRVHSRGHDPEEFMDRARAFANFQMRGTKARPLASDEEFVTRLCVHCQLAVMRCVAHELGVR